MQYEISGKIDILSLSLPELSEKLTSMDEQKFRAKQIYQWLHNKQVTSFDEMTNLSAQLREKLAQSFCINSLFIVKKLASCSDNTLKYLYRLYDGNHIESVVIEYNHGTSLCVSTQVGCKMGCNFCASTIAGFKRNLLPSEILLQVYEAQRDSGRKISSIVLMGIGEPLDNFDNVIRFFEIVSSPEGMNLSLRHVSLSTCGVVPKIYELAKLRLGVTLSVSLHASSNESRSKTMPINNRYDINELITACRDYFEETGRRISFEYAVIEGVNDSIEDAKRLKRLMNGLMCHINLIPVNKIDERDYTSSKKSTLSFQKYLCDMGLNATVRRTLGADINAACGQLRREYEI